MADGRLITAKLPGGFDDLSFRSMRGEDRISDCYAYTVRLSGDAPFKNHLDILGQPASVTVSGEDYDRVFHGLASDWALTEVKGGIAEYEMVLRPWLWFLGKRTNCKIFQEKSIIEIIEEVFSDYPEAKFEKRLQGTYDPREYCVQYDETDLAFVQRLMEHEGVFYFFEHSEDGHTLIITDANSKLEPIPGFESVEFESGSIGAYEDHDFITSWKPSASARSGSYTHVDYDFTKPSADLMSKDESKLGHEIDDKEVYSHPGSHDNLGRGDAIAKVRREELQSMNAQAHAKGSVRGVWPGSTFKLTEFPDESQNVDHIVISARYEMADPQYAMDQGFAEGVQPGFQIEFVTTPKEVMFRPERTTTRPVMRGPQTAQVVGPAGEEIYTDEYSRVKVQFYWDRLGGKDENSSCFVRVSSVWAGSGWGFIQIPRIGQEVIVDFIEGDPDKPIITGRVYNAEQMPPYELPANATQSGWKSNSSLGGGGWNELRFEDKKGSEEVYFQAEKDHNELVKNNESRDIMNDFLENVHNDAEQNITRHRTETVGGNKSTDVTLNRDVHIGQNDTETVDINRSLTVGGNETIHVVGTSTENIDMNNFQTVGLLQKMLVKGGRMRQVGLGETVAVAGLQAITVGKKRDVKVGSNQSHYVQAKDSYEVKGDQTTKLHSEHTMTVGKNQSFDVTGGRLIKVGKGQTHDVTEDVWIKAGKAMMLEAADSITLKCGSATLQMKKDGTITIDGKDISTKASGKIVTKASSTVTIKGSKIIQN